MASIRRALVTAAVALAGATALAAPAGASVTDGTSNTISFGELRSVSVSSLKLDASHHRLLVAGAALTPGARYPTATVRTPSYTIILSDILISGYSGTQSALSLNFTKVEFMDYTDDDCLSVCVVGGQFGEED